MRWHHVGVPRGHLLERNVATATMALRDVAAAMSIQLGDSGAAGHIGAMPPMIRRLLPVAALILAIAPPARAASGPTTPQLCEAAVTAAETASRLPPRLLGAIALVETGRPDAAGRIRPWPWTINAEGAGQFFASKAEAVAAVKALQARGVRSIDVGCLQVNLMHHPDAFARLEDAFDPVSNARYAARFLSALHAGFGDWRQAIGAYHSQTPALGAEYRALVQARWERPWIGQTELTHPAYADFAPRSTAYRAFPDPASVYGAFVRR